MELELGGPSITTHSPRPRSDCAHHSRDLELGGDIDGWFFRSVCRSCGAVLDTWKMVRIDGELIRVDAVMTCLL